MVDTLTEVGEMIGEGMKQQKSTELSRIDPGTISSYFVFGNYRFKVRVTKVLIEQQLVGNGAGIYGSSVFGIYGTATYGSEAVSSFILGNPYFGILGTSQLGSQASEYVEVEEVILNQTIPTIARTEIAKWIASEATENPDYLALGLGTTEYSETDTELENEIARKSVTYDIGTDKKIEYQIEILSVDTDYYQYTEDFSTDTYRDAGETTADWGGL